jgi:hypothetical protein
MRKDISEIAESAKKIEVRANGGISVFNHSVEELVIGGLQWQMKLLPNLCLESIMKL